MPPPIGVRICEQVALTNQYLETLITLFVRAFPQSVTKEMTEEIKQMRKKREAIGFGQPERD